MLPLWLAQTEVQTTQKGQELGRMLYNELEQGDILSGVRVGLALLAYTDILLCSIWAMHRIRQTPVWISIQGHASFADLGEQVQVVRGDVTQFEDVMRVTLEAKPSRILNLAYLLGSGGGQPRFAMKLNILGMDNCFEAARLCGVKRVVYASSVAVSGLQKHFGERLANEDDATYGTSQYAVHKIFNEFQAQQYNKNYGMSITGVRPANVTGPDKVRGSVDHVRPITLPAQGKPVHLPWKAMMRLPVHVEDITRSLCAGPARGCAALSCLQLRGIPLSVSGDLRGASAGSCPRHSYRCQRRWH